MELEDYTTPLVPVSDWPWQLFRVTWLNTATGNTRPMWAVSTDTHIDSECQERWPSDYWDRVEWEAVANVSEPPRRPSQYGVAHVDIWTHGSQLAKKLGFTG